MQSAPEASKDFFVRGAVSVLIAVFLCALSNALRISAFTRSDLVTEGLVFLFLLANFHSWVLLAETFAPSAEPSAKRVSGLQMLLLKTFAVILIVSILYLSRARGAALLMLSLLTFLFGGVLGVLRKK